MNRKIFLMVVLLPFFAFITTQGMKKGTVSQEAFERILASRQFVSNIPTVTYWENLRSGTNFKATHLRGKTAEGGLVYIYSSFNADRTISFEGEYYPTESGEAQHLTPELAESLAKKATSKNP